MLNLVIFEYVYVFVNILTKVHNWRKINRLLHELQDKFVLNLKYLIVPFVIRIVKSQLIDDFYRNKIYCIEVYVLVEVILS